MPVTTVSGKIAALESRLGITLIQRTTRKLNLTEAGERYFQHCLKAVRELEVADAEVLSTKHEPGGSLKITAPPDIGHLILTPIVTRFLGEHSNVHVELILTNRIVDLVGEGVDLGVRVGALKDSSLITKKFFDLKMGLFAGSQYLEKWATPKTPQSLEAHYLICFKPFGTKVRMFHPSTGQQVSATVKSKITVDDIEAVKSFVLAGEGIGVLSPFLVDEEVKAGKLVEVLPKWKLKADASGEERISFVYPSQAFVPPNVQEFIRIAGTFCTEH